MVRSFKIPVGQYNGFLQTVQCEDSGSTGNDYSCSYHSLHGQIVAQLNAQIEELMAKFEEDASELKAKNDVQNVEVTEVEVGPKSSDIYDEKLYLLWK